MLNDQSFENDAITRPVAVNVRHFERLHGQNISPHINIFDFQQDCIDCCLGEQ